MKNKEKRKLDKGKLATRIIAAVMAGLMVLGTVYTFIYYIINYK